MNLFLQLRKKLILNKYKNSPAFGRYYKEVNLNTPISETTFVVFDTETSGLNPKKAQLLSLGAVKIEALSVDCGSVFHRFVLPHAPINPSSVEVHGLSPAELQKKGEPADEVIKDFLDYAKGTVLVGFYTSFDLRVVSRYALELFGIPLLNYYLDAFELYRRRYHVSKSLDDVARELDIPLTARHSALDDSYITALVFLKLVYNRKSEPLKHLPLHFA